MRSIEKVPQIENSADTGGKSSTQEHLGDLPGDPACQAEEEGVKEMDSPGAVEETKASGEPEASLIYEHPEHEDGLVAEAQRVFYPLEVGKLDGIQKEQPVQEKPGEAEIQQDKITVAQWPPPHHDPKIHQENEGIDQDPYCKLQD